MEIGGIKLKNNLILAPMAGYTDVGFRGLCAEGGAGLTVTEMVSAKGLVYGSNGSKELLYISPKEGVTAAQLFGSEPDFMYKAAKLPVLDSFDIIDINAGCPVPKIVKNGEGSALLAEPDLLAELVEAVIEGSRKPVTVKLRLGLSRAEMTAVRCAEAAERAGAAAVAVHGRTRDMYYSGEADWAAVRAVKSAVKIPVIANGNVVDKDSLSACAAISAADGFMIGRAALGYPYIFSELMDYPFVFDVKASILQHIAELKVHLPDKVVANNMKKHLCFYAKNLTLKKQFRTAVMAADSLEDILAVVERYF